MTKPIPDGDEPDYEAVHAKAKAAEQSLKAALESHQAQIQRPEDERVPICGTPGATVSRAIWDEAWIAYAKRYGGSTANPRQYARLLREGFYAGELDELRPGWRPVDAQLESQQAQIRELTEARGLLQEAYDMIGDRLLEDVFGYEWVARVRKALRQERGDE